MRLLCLTILVIWAGSFMGQTSIVRGEWFIDQDPGIGLANPIPSFDADTSVSVEIQLDLSLLSAGFHQFYSRFINANGNWSHTIPRGFYVLPRDSAAELAYLEWFWDDDPGLGQGNIITSLEGNIDSATWNINLGNIPSGIHQLYFRTKSEEGVWSHTYLASTFIIPQPEALIDRISYVYIDASSGRSDSINYSLMTPQAFVDISFDPEVNGLEGNQSYELCLTAIRTDNKISFEKCQSFVWEGSVGIEPSTSIPGIKLYPNPSSGDISITLPEERSGTLKYSIWTLQGRQLSAQLIYPQDASRLKVDISTLPAGTYFVNFEMGQKLLIKKLQIQ